MWLLNSHSVPGEQRQLLSTLSIAAVIAETIKRAESPEYIDNKISLKTFESADTEL